jgi:hypothetical protein
MEISPRSAFRRLFDAGSAEQRAARRRQQSVLDSVSQEIGTLQGDSVWAISAGWEYPTCVRSNPDSEAEQQSATNITVPDAPSVSRHARQHLKLMFDLIALAPRPTSRACRPSIPRAS